MPLPSQKERLHTERANVEESINRFRARLFLLRQEEAKQWLMEVLGIDESDVDDGDGAVDVNDEASVSALQDGSGEQFRDFVAKLRDGVWLCQLAETWREEGEPFKYHRNVVKGSTMEFMKINDNINKFYDACGKIGFPSTYLFTFVDIFERRNITNVVHCIHALAHYLHQSGLCGVKIKDLSKKNIEFDQAEIDRLEKEFDEMEASGNLPNLNFDFGIEANDGDDGGFDFEDQSGGFDFGDSGADFDAGIDPRFCTLEGKGARRATAGEWSLCTVTTKNQFGDAIETGGNAEDFLVYLSSVDDPDAAPIEAEVLDLGNGQYEIGYCVNVAGGYELHIKYDGVQLQDGPFRVKVVPGSISPDHCLITDPDSVLQRKEYYEGQQYQFKMTAMDQFGNVCMRGGEHFIADFKLQSSKYVPTGQSFHVSEDDISMEDNGDGTYNVQFSAPMPGKYAFGVRHGNQVIKLPSGSDHAVMTFFEMPDPDLHFSFEKFDSGASVAQYCVRTISPIEGMVSDPKYVSVVMANPFPANVPLTEHDQSQMTQFFKAEMKQWLDSARKAKAARLFANNDYDQNGGGGMMDDDGDSDNNKNFYWNLLSESVNDEAKGERLKFCMNRDYKFSHQNNGIDFVTVSDERMDWQDFEARRRQEQLEREHFEKMRMQRQLQQQQQLQTDQMWQHWNPNKQGTKPRTAALNFWVIVSHMMSEAKKQKGRAMDEHAQIWKYDNRDISVRQHANPDVFSVARKEDVKSYSSVQLKVAQTYVFQLLDEFSTLLPESHFSIVQPMLLQRAKESFEVFKQSHVICDNVLKGNMILKGDLKTEVDDEMLEQAKKFVLSIKRRFLLIVKDNVVMKFKDILSSQLGMANEEIDKLSIKSTYFKTQLPQLYLGWKQCFSFTMTGQSRRIMVQELIFKTPFRDKLNQIVTTQSFSIQIPINSLFDSALYGDKKRSNLSSYDRAQQGLVNPWKSVYVKSGVVMWEALRTGSLTAIGISDQDKRAQATMANAVELLRVTAVNHCKRFSRIELTELISRGESLRVPFTSLSLLTPFFVSREDRQFMEHQSALLEVAKRGLVDEVVVDLHDGKSYMTVPVRFKDVCLLNFGTNFIIKTFKFGLGIQRAINNRTPGMRMFENKVIKFLKEITMKKEQLRQEVMQYLQEVVFTSTRSGAMFLNTLGPLVKQMDLVRSQLQKIENDISKEIQVMDFKMEAKQRKLEKRIRNDWLPKFDSITSVEFVYQRKIRSLANDLDSLHARIFAFEKKKLADKMEEVLEVEQLFVRDVSKVLNQTTSPQHQALIAWNEYVALFIKEKDIRQMFNDLRDLYHSKSFESFGQGLVESTEVKEVDPYAVPVRILLLAFIIGDQVHFNCKSGKDRTGIAQDQVQEFAELRAQFNEYPNFRQEKKKFNDFRRMIFTNIALNSGNMDIVKQNLALPGVKTDTTISGRFIPGFYSRYRGLSSLSKIKFAGTDADFDEMMKVYLRGG